MTKVGVQGCATLADGRIICRH